MAEEEAYVLYKQALEKDIDEYEKMHGYRVCGAHCDNLVLHRADECVYCADFTIAQEARRELGINNTGHYDRKYICPAEQCRNEPKIHLWGGNRPRKTKLSGNWYCG